jgi:Ser/Thr protein kinase RdoA (MazF antagonist)
MSRPDGLEILETEGHFVRLLSWIPGVPLGDVKRPSAALFEDLGRRVGELGRALADFDHPAAHRQFQWDLAAAFSTIAGHLPSVGDAAWRTFLAQEVEQLERRHAPERLRRSVIHNDANDYNVLVSGGDDPRTRYQRVAGMLDFGDLVHSFTIADLAVTVAYAVLDKPQPLRVASRIVSGYHASYALPEGELSQLFDWSG